MTDQGIEAAAKKAGGRWDGSRWMFEDADLHPFARALLAAERERCAQIVEYHNPGGSYRIRTALAAEIRRA